MSYRDKKKYYYIMNNLLLLVFLTVAEFDFDLNMLRIRPLISLFLLLVDFDFQPALNIQI